MYTVFVIGAGFSADLGYPITSGLLPRLTQRFQPSFAAQFKRIVRFHHPSWDGRSATLPAIEQLLTELSANEELLPALDLGGDFDTRSLERFQEDLLRQIASWFHEIHKNRKSAKSKVIGKFLKLLADAKNPVVISFNWDYELDKAMFGSDQAFGVLSPRSYGLNTGELTTPSLLKPHGSLNWYPASSGKHIRKDLRLRLWKPRASEKSMYCFLRWRAVQSNQGRRYIPWVVPPTHWKRFDHPMMQHIWKRCVQCLSKARHVYFLGYSLPSGDWHSRYILRCGFYNQVKGFPRSTGGRAKPTGTAGVTVVNPDNEAFRRIESTCGVPARWIDTTIRSWLAL